MLHPYMDTVANDAARATLAAVLSANSRGDDGVVVKQTDTGDYWLIITTPSLRQVNLTATGLTTGTYTPVAYDISTLAAINLGTGATITGEYRRSFGATCDVRVAITLGTSPSLGGNGIAITMPFTRSTGVSAIVGTALCNGIAIGYFPGFAYSDGASGGARDRVVMLANVPSPSAGRAGQLQYLTSGAPFTWAAGDKIELQVRWPS